MVAYNSLMDVHDMPGAMRDAARVLRPDGKLCVCVTHPLADAGRFAGEQADAPFVITGSYLDSARFEGRFERDGREMTFRGWSYRSRPTAARWRRRACGIETLREPPIPADAARRHPEYRCCRGYRCS